MKPTHSGRLERWLGTERVENLSRSMRGWYADPIRLVDVPGAVYVNGDGDFSGPLDVGAFAMWGDYVWDKFKRNLNRALAPKYGTFHAGFSSLSDFINKSTANGQVQQYNMSKAGPTGVAGVTSTLWYVGNQPLAGIGAAATPGTSFTSASTGALTFTDPNGTDLTFCTGGDLTTSVAAMSLLLFDRLVSVAPSMTSSTSQAIAPVSPRYTRCDSATAPDNPKGNFMMLECNSALGAVAHNNSVAYTNQASVAAHTTGARTGVSAAIIHRLDHTPPDSFFLPLQSGDTGVFRPTNFLLSASLGGRYDLTLAHPIAFFSLPIANLITPFDFVFQRAPPPQVQNGACLALLEINKSATTATNYTGNFTLVQG